jgi:hypothetical protein
MFTYKAIRRTFFFADHYQPTHQGVKYLIFWMNSSHQMKYRGKTEDICTDGAKAMMGHNAGAIAKIKEIKVFRWHMAFKDGRESVEEEQRSGRL